MRWNRTWWRSAIVRGALQPRTWALASGAVLTLTYLSVLYEVVDVVGGGGLGLFAAEIAGAVALAIVLSQVLSGRAAVGLGVALLVGGLAVYLATVPGTYFDFSRQLGDTIALLTGLSVLRMTKAGIWALGFTPGPLFVSWYFLLRRRYVVGTIVGGAALSLFVLTGDVGQIVGLVGVLGAVGTVGFGDIDRGDLSTEDGEAADATAGPEKAMGWQLSRRMLLMAIVTTSVSLVPGGEARPLLPGRRQATVEGSLVDAANRVSILGSIRLSPTVRFTVTAERADYWRVGAYDRYTGGDWIRTGESSPYRGPLVRPEGSDLRRIRQTYEVESSVATMPAAWKPVRLGVGAATALVTDMHGLQPADALEEGEQYSVESFRNDPPAEALRKAGTDYPAGVRERFLQLPETTPARVGSFTADLTANAENAFDTAAIIEQWLQRNKGYSLDVNRPSGDVAAAFLFEMERGYCVYFATTMIVMLRSQGIPARFAVGYTPGQQVAENRWVVRGLDSHAWVEVYFPDEGWIRFDPTPAGPRQAAESARIEQARALEEANVDTGLSEQETATNDSTANGTATPGVGSGLEGQLGPRGNTTAAQPLGGAEGPLQADAGNDGSGGGLLGSLPSSQTMAYGGLLFAGAVMVLHRAGILDRGYRELWLRRSIDGSPVDRITGAFERVEYLLERRYRPREEGETRRRYVEELRGRDERVMQLYRLYERARYRGEATEAEAREARDLLGELMDERLARR